MQLTIQLEVFANDCSLDIIVRIGGNVNFVAFDGPSGLPFNIGSNFGNYREKGHMNLN
jgi:hypothetical protein